MSAVPQLPYAGQPSGTTRWLPALSEHILEAYSRIQIRGAAISIEHVIEARRSSNYILQEWGNRGVNLWKVAEEGYPDICIPMQPGVSTYDIPRDTVNLLDSYIRIFTPSAQTFNIGIPLVPMVRQSEGPTITNPPMNLGNVLVPFVTQGSNPIYLLTDDGQIILDDAGNPIVVTPGEPSIPIVSQPYGDPMVAQPGSGTLSCVAGSPMIILNWSSTAAHPGGTIIWGCPISIGGLAISGRSTIIAVSGGQVTFEAPAPARETQTNQGATPLFWTTGASPSVGCILPGHGLSAGQTFTVPIPTTVGGITLSGTYTVGAVTSSYEFFFGVGSPTVVYLFASPGVPLLNDQGVPLIADWDGTGAPMLNGAEFENHGQINVASTYTLTIISPIFTQPYGDPIVEQPGSNTMSIQAGSQYVTLRWPAHCLIPGSPVFWLTPISIGGISVFGFSVVVEVIDWQTVTFMLPKPALETQTNQGQTPLFWTSLDTPLVGVNLPGHGLCQNDLFEVGVATLVGAGIGATGAMVPGIELFGPYPIVFVENSYNFFINPTGQPIEFLLTDSGGPLLDDSGIPLVADMSSNFASTVVFENGGQMRVSTQQAGMQWTDIFLWPISRNDYAFLPDKEAEGRPTTYWFNRAIYPTITVWPVPLAPQGPSGFKLEPQLLLTDSGQPIIGPNGQPITTGNVIQVPTFLLPPLAFPQPPSPLGPGPFFAFIGYRMRELEDANPMSGQGLDAPRRFFPVFAAELACSLSEKYKPEVYQQKMQIAMALWDRASTEDREKIEWAIQPDFAAFDR